MGTAQEPSIYDIEYYGLKISVKTLLETNNELFSSKTSPSVRNKLNSRNRLLKIFKDRPILELKRHIKNLNIEIKNYFFSEKRNNVRHKIIPGNCKSLWNAVNTAYDNGTTSLPECMTLGGVGVDVHERSDCFAKHFEQKVKTITENVTVTGQVYNGYRKVFAHEEMFMSINEVDKCIRYYVKVKGPNKFVDN